MTLHECYLEKLVSLVKKHGQITLEDLALTKEFHQYAQKTHNLNLSIAETRWGLTLKIA